MEKKGRENRWGEEDKRDEEKGRNCWRMEGR